MSPMPHPGPASGDADVVDLDAFACIADFDAHARATLPPAVRDYYASGALSETTLHDNLDAYAGWRFAKRVLVDVSSVRTATTVLDFELDVPWIAAPTAFHRMAHPDGELATAAALRDAGSAMILSTLATTPIEEVAAVGVPRWFQLYIHKDRGLTEELVQRAKAAGFGALVLTVDTPQLGVRWADVRNHFALPEGIELANLRARKLPDGADSGLFAYVAQQIDASLTWDDLTWLRDLAGMPIVVKGITTGADASRALDAGVDAIVVSNHGGRQLDGDLATLDALPEVVAAIGGRVPVLVDGGIRSGAHVVMALCLGARAVLLGRPVLWGLAAGGRPGLAHLLALLHKEFVNSLQLLGVPDVAECGPEFVRRVRDVRSPGAVGW